MPWWLHLYCYVDVFYTHFLFLFAVSGFVLVKSFCKKKKFKTDLMTSFLLLLIGWNNRNYDGKSNDIFLACCDALVYLVVPVHTKYSTTFVWGDPFTTYVSNDQFFNTPPTCKHMYAIRVISILVISSIWYSPLPF